MHYCCFFVFIVWYSLCILLEQNACLRHPAFLVQTDIFYIKYCSGTRTLRISYTNVKETCCIPEKLATYYVTDHFGGKKYIMTSTAIFLYKGEHTSV